MFKRRSNCSKCIDVYEKGLRSETRFKESLKKLTSKEKSFINNRIKDRRKIIHKKFETIFRDEAGTMLSVIENVANKKKMNRMKQQMQLRDEQQLMNKWEKTRLLQKKTRRNNAAKKIQTMFKKTRKSRKKRSPKMSTKLDKYQRNMLEVLGADNENYSDPEDIALKNELFDDSPIQNILVPLDYEREERGIDLSSRLKPSFRYHDSRRLTAKQKMEAADRNLKVHKAYMKKKSKLTAKEKKAGIKEIDRRMEDNKKPYRYSATTFDDDFKPKPKKKGIFSGLFGTKKGGRRTRKKRKRKRTRKKRKRRRRRTRK